MSETILDSSLFRNVYCYVAGGSEGCVSHGYSEGFLPAGYEWLAFAITAAVLAILFIQGALGGVLALIWGERRILARFQNRVGPNRWGPFGSLTSVADAIKTMFKEDIVPDQADRFLFNLAPVIMVVPVLMVFAVIPIGVGTLVADLNIGLLFVIAITSASGLAIAMAAWSSANRIAIFSGLRAVALLVSYEIPMALSLLGVLMITGTLSMTGTIEAQDVPFIIVQPLGFLVFFLAALAEMSRTPFDLTEAESELAAGHLNDYSSMKFGVLFLAEWAATVAGAMIIATVFLSGWRGFSPIPSHIWFVGKVVAVIFLIIWIRATWPRLRIDQVLSLAWKGLFELTMINLIVTAILTAAMADREADGSLFSAGELWIMAAVNWAVFFPSVYLIGKLLASKPYEDDSSEPQELYPVATEEKAFEGAAD
ncbi:MAG: NADH-quinone oxidoreductase subunit NuoH [Chloroflexi bacterium]|nr:NADH-quinone oxidoreductase subunit NuoH [Chloroflexota bacterium]